MATSEVGMNAADTPLYEEIRDPVPYSNPTRNVAVPATSLIHPLPHTMEPQNKELHVSCVVRQ